MNATKQRKLKYKQL